MKRRREAKNKNIPAAKTAGGGNNSRLTLKTRLLSVLLVLCLSVTIIAQTNVFGAQSDNETAENPQPNERQERLSEYSFENIPSELAENTGLARREVRAVALDGTDAENLDAFTTINEDDSKTVFAYNQPVKYIDQETGKIKFIDNTLKSVNRNGKTVYENAANDIRVSIPERASGGISAQFENAALTVRPVTAGDSVGTQKEYAFMGLTHRVVEYANAFGEGIHLQYTPVNTGVKDIILMERYTGINTFQFKLKTEGAVPDCAEGRTITFSNPETGKQAFTLSHPWAADSFDGASEANDVKADAVHLATDNFYTLETTGENEYLLTMHIDRAFLENPATVYPVFIDPTVTFSNTTMLDNSPSQYSGGASSSTWNTVGWGAGPGEHITYIKLASGTLNNYTYIYPATIKSVYYHTYWLPSSTAAKVYDSSTTVSVQSATFGGIKTPERVCRYIHLPIRRRDLRIFLLRLCL